MKIRPAGAELYYVEGQTDMTTPSHFSKISRARLKTSHLMLYRKIIAVCSQIHTKHINTLCGQNVGLLNVKPGGTYSDHWAELYIKIQLVPRSKHTLGYNNQSVNAV